MAEIQKGLLYFSALQIIKSILECPDRMEDITKYKLNHMGNRKSGIELLRIFAAMGVVLLHYNDGRAFN